MSFTPVELKDAEVFLVGGAVRDQLLGRTFQEKDWVVVGSNRTQMLELGYRQVGHDFPVFLHPDTHEEYALARLERKSGSGHTGFETRIDKVTLEQDLSRRDLTINAIAQSANGEIIDPHQGRADLDKRVLRHVSDAFSEDPLRVLRIARFAAQLSNYDFQLADETMELLRAMSKNGDLESLTPERVWRETEKALQSDRPRTYFETLRAAGALEVIFPEVDRLFGVAQRPDFHPEIDAGLHTMLSLDRISEATEDSKLRFAVLTHDLGKATTPEHILPSHTGHEERSAQLTETLCDRLRVPNDYRKLAVPVARYHLLCHRALDLSAQRIEQLLSNLGAFQQHSQVSDFTQCCMADARGRTGLESRLYPQAEFLKECQAVAKVADAKELLSQGFSGKELGERLKFNRAQRIQPIIDKYADIDELQYARVPISD